MRFLIPTFPFFAAAGAWLLSVIARHLGTAGRVAVGVVAALQLLVTGTSSQQTLERTKSSLTAAARARVLAEKRIPAGSIVIVDRALAESIDAVGRWRLVEEGIVGGMGARGGPGMGLRPMGAGGPMEANGNRPSPQQVGKNHAQQERYAGLNAAERRARVWADLAAWATASTSSGQDGGRTVYWFTRSLDVMENALPSGADYESVAEIDAPTMGFGPGGPGGGPMGMAGGPMGAGGGRGAMRGRGFDPMPFVGPRGGAEFGGPGGPGGFAGEGGKLRLVKVTLGKT